MAGPLFSHLSGVKLQNFEAHASLLHYESGQRELLQHPLFVPASHRFNLVLASLETLAASL